MKVIRVDDETGCDILEISEIELDRLCTHVRDKAISDFAEALRLECLDDPCKTVGIYKILRCSSAMRGEKR